MWKRCSLVLALFISLTASSQTYYIVRHAEKATADASAGMMTNDPPLTEVGVARAEALGKLLKEDQIAHIFSTNTIRTRSTAAPLSRITGVQIETYESKPTAEFIKKLKSLKANVLVVGHSNTVDDIVNMLAGEQKVAGDLKDTEYDNLFVVTIKDKKITVEQKKFGPQQ